MSVPDINLESLLCLLSPSATDGKKKRRSRSNVESGVGRAPASFAFGPRSSEESTARRAVAERLDDAMSQYRDSDEHGGQSVELTACGTRRRTIEADDAGGGGEGAQPSRRSCVCFATTLQRPCLTILAIRPWRLPQASQSHGEARRSVRLLSGVAFPY